MFLLKLQTAKTSPLYPISALCVHSVLKWAAGFVFQKCLCSDSLHIDGFFLQSQSFVCIEYLERVHQVCTSVCQPKVSTLSSSMHICLLAQGRYIIIKYAHLFVSPRSVHYYQVCTSVCQPKFGTLSSSMHIRVLAQGRYIIIKYAHPFVFIQLIFFNFFMGIEFPIGFWTCSHSVVFFVLFLISIWYSKLR